MHPHRTKCARPFKFAVLQLVTMVDCLVSVLTLGFFVSHYGSELLFSEWADDIDE